MGDEQLADHLAYRANLAATPTGVRLWSDDTCVAELVVWVWLSTGGGLFCVSGHGSVGVLEAHKLTEIKWFL